jgi:transcriptional regulator GlxA family with amidase domain
MNGLALSDSEETELYVLLKPREGRLDPALVQVLRRLEKSLYEKLTIEEMERLGARFAQGR